MRPITALIVFLSLVFTSAFFGLTSYNVAQQFIDEDLQTALVDAEHETDGQILATDTIQAVLNLRLASNAEVSVLIADDTLRRHLKMARLREKAFLKVRLDNSNQIQYEATSTCSMADIFALSDQRLSLLFIILACLWLAGYGCYFRKAAQTPRQEKAIGNLRYDPIAHRFFVRDEEVRFTDMQLQLMEMFIDSPSHELSKSTICETLWPKKEDPSETLYTLIRRLKTTLSASSNLGIENNRGRTYILIETK